MSDAFADKLFDYGNSNGLFEGIGRVLLAVSGGADSVAMACALHRLRQEGRLGCEFVIGHVNHGLRGSESDADEALVKELGQSLGIAVVTEAVDVQAYAAAQKLSIETAGRRLRLDTLASMAKQRGCRRIATAHHRDDQAETIVHRLMRGTGFRGLCGIGPISEVYGAKFIRPMLGFRRHEILQYCMKNNLVWREDASNCNMHFTRNRIRHRLLPVLAGDKDVIVERLFALSIESRRFLQRVEKQARSILEKGHLDEAKKQMVLEQCLVRDCPPWVFYEVMRQVLVCLNIGLRDYKQEHFDSVRELVERKKAKADFPGGVEVVVEKSKVFIQPQSRSNENAGDSVGGDHPPYVLRIGQTIQFGQWKISSRLFNRNEVNVKQFLKNKDAFVEWFDADKISGPIEVRQQQKGDKFWPIGAKSEKKTARFLLDSGLDMQTRQGTFVIQDAEKILWLAPVRMSEPAKVTDNTNGIMQISVGLI